MEAFDTFYRPDTPSQRYRLLAMSFLPLLLGLLPWITPLKRRLSDWASARVMADLWATGLRIWGSKPPYPSPLYLVGVLLIVLAVSSLLHNVSLQIGVLRGFAPDSRMLRLAQWLLCIIGVELLALIWAWPSH